MDGCAICFEAYVGRLPVEEFSEKYIGRCADPALGSTGRLEESGGGANAKGDEGDRAFSEALE